MNYNSLPDNHYTIITANDVAEICKPLFQRYNLNYFVYARVFDNGTTYALISNGEYQKHHFKKGYMLAPPVSPKILSKKFYYVLTGNEPGPFQPALYDFYNLFNFWYPIFLVERDYGFYDLYILCSKPDNYEAINFYINNMDVLENFKFYFKEKAAKLIEKSEKNIIQVPEYMRSTFGGLQKTSEESAEIDKQTFLDQISARRYTLNDNNREISLTKREIDVLKHLRYGRTNKEIAKLMHISPRTIEAYINNVKFKFGLQRKSEIINTVSEHGLLVPFPN